MSRTHPTVRTVAALVGLGATLTLAACGTELTGGTQLPRTQPTQTADTQTAHTQTADTRTAHTTRTSHSANVTRGGTGPRTTTAYAELVSAWRATPAGYGLSYDRVGHLTGQAAIDFQKKAFPGEDPYSDAYPNVNPRLRQVVLAPTAAIYGNQQLGPGQGTRGARISGDQLVDRVEQHPRTLVRMVMRVVDGRTQVIRMDEIYTA